MAVLGQPASFAHAEEAISQTNADYDASAQKEAAALNAAANTKRARPEFSLKT